MRRHGDSPQETGTEKAPLGTGLSLQGGDFRLKQLQSYDLPAKSAVTFRQRKQQNDRRATLSETASAPWRSARWPRPILFLRATEPSQLRRVGTMSLKEWNVRPSSTDSRVWEARCGERIMARGTMDHAWHVAMNAAREARGRAQLFYRLREGIKDSVDFRQPIKRGRPFKHRVTG